MQACGCCVLIHTCVLLLGRRLLRVLHFSVLITMMHCKRNGLLPLASQLQHLHDRQSLDLDWSWMNYALLLEGIYYNFRKLHLLYISWTIIQDYADSESLAIMKRTLKDLIGGGILSPSTKICHFFLIRLFLLSGASIIYLGGCHLCGSHIKYIIIQTHDDHIVLTR